MCWTIVFTGLNTILSSFLLATHHQKEQARLLLLVYVMYLVSTLILIPAHGYIVKETTFHFSREGNSLLSRAISRKYSSL